MKQFADWITQRPYRAGLMAAALALVPLLGIVGSGLLVLTALRRGSTAAWLATATAVLILTVASALGGSGAMAAAFVGLVFWAPAVGLAEVLKRSGSLSLAVQTATAASVLLALLWVITGGGNLPASMDRQVTGLLEEAGFQQAAIDAALALVPGAMALALLLAALGGLFIGMAWHASLVSPGALGKAFRSLRLGKTFAGLGLLVLAGGLWSGGTVVGNLLVVVLAAFTLQGLALVHAAVAIRRWPAAALAAVYVLLIFGLSVMGPLLAVAGMADNWIDFRGRMAGDAPD